MGRSLEGSHGPGAANISPNNLIRQNNDLQRSLKGVNKPIYLIKDIICVIKPRPRRKKKRALLKQRTYLIETYKHNAQTLKVSIQGECNLV